MFIGCLVLVCRGGGCARDQYQRGVAGVKMGQVRHAVGEHRAARTRVGVGRAQHGVIDDQLGPAVEEFRQASRTAWRFEAVAIVHRLARQATPCGCKPVQRAGERLLFGEQFGACLDPGIAGCGLRLGVVF